MKDIFIISLKGFENSFFNSFKILVGILFGPLALFVFIELIRSSMFSGTVGERKIVFVFRAKILKMSFFALTIFLFIFSVILVKKLLKQIEICLVLVINILSIRRLEIDSSDLFFMFIMLFMVCQTSFKGFVIVVVVVVVVSKESFVIRLFCLPK